MSDRKYKQKGYQDSPREGGPQAPKPRPPQERAPGRQLQDERGPKTPNLMAAREVFRCTRCGNLLSLPVGLLDYTAEFTMDWRGMCALAVVMIIPALVLTFIVQKHLVGGLTSGAVKG